MPRVRLQPDTLNEENRRFSQTPLTQPVFINSVPKSGTHLLRNIIRMFVPVEQQYDAQFIQWPNLHQHLEAFDTSKNYLSWGHLLFSDESAFELAGVRKLILVRDPYSWVLARTRFFLSEEFQSNIERVKDGTLQIDELMTLMIFGVHQKTPPLSEMYMFNAVSWLGTSAKLVRYEDLIKNLKSLDTPEAEAYFSDLLGACGIAMTEDWRTRIRIGADRKQSGTARENLHTAEIEIPSELPDTHKRLVNVAAPGIRSLLGYE
ncbi:MAG: hypothetical protein HKN14_01195 [Marinicaulis sp.]|nr:hypothetical protein [Marinicaulis sp.]NNE39513.1 hypothetical protein [Marinicaulis sp.]NNL88125.1 hypothetical protein [Marinicaulis sp.]